MSQLNQADRFLLQAVRAGDADAWRQLVERFHGRLLAFAQSRLGGAASADAEDLCQDTFVGFLKSLPGFREESALETFLFTILRRRIVDYFRARPRGAGGDHVARVCLLDDVVRRDGAGESGPAASRLPAPDPTASWYARRSEQDDLQRRALARAVRTVVDGLKRARNLRDLKAMELLFYCQLGNKAVAEAAGLSENQVALLKHRWLKRIRELIAGDEGLSRHGAGAVSDALLTEVWETLRPSCPKRNTIGAYLLGTLDEGWQDYLDFHLHTLGCRFCLANLDDLKRRTASADDSALRRRILASTIGFLRQSRGES